MGERRRGAERRGGLDGRRETEKGGLGNGGMRALRKGGREHKEGTEEEEVGRARVGGEGGRTCIT